MVMMETARKMKEPFAKTVGKGKMAMESEREVEFTYHAPAAKKVCLAGKFNDWNTKSLPMKKERDGNWKTTVRLTPGRYEYKYFVDGYWAQDAPCAEMVSNPFGSRNCVISVK